MGNFNPVADKNKPEVFPCPLCGSEVHHYMDDMGSVIKCKNEKCKLSGLHPSSLKTDLKMWNEMSSVKNESQILGDVAADLTTEIENLTAKLAAAAAELKLFRILESESLDLRCISIPTGGDDYDIGWQVIEHYQAEPQERVIGYGSTPCNALKQAIDKLNNKPIF